MNKERVALLSTEVVLMLLTLGFLVPRLANVGPRALSAVNSDERVLATVGYAKHRVWYDFLKGRKHLEQSAALPEPTLEEYHRFLAGLGLRSRGDVISFLVLPVLREDRLSRQIDVCLSQAQAPVVLQLYVPDSLGYPHNVGRLDIHAPSGGPLTCLAAPAAESRLLAYWPLRPVALLP